MVRLLWFLSQGCSLNVLFKWFNGGCNNSQSSEPSLRRRWVKSIPFKLKKKLSQWITAHLFDSITPVRPLKMNQWKGKTKNELEMFSSPVIDIDDSWFLWSLCFTVLPNKIPDFGNLNNKDGYQAHSVPLGVGYDSVGRPGISQNASWTRSRPKWRTYPNRLCSSNLGLVLHCIVLFTLHCFVPGFRSRLKFVVLDFW